MSDEQITLAKEANGKRKRMTHVLIAGDYGQIYGTEKQCLKYYNVWKDIFKELFDGHANLQFVEQIEDYKSTFNLVKILISEHDKLPSSTQSKLKALEEELKEEAPKKSFLQRLFGL